MAAEFESFEELEILFRDILRDIKCGGLMNGSPCLGLAWALGAISAGGVALDEDLRSICDDYVAAAGDQAGDGHELLEAILARVDREGAVSASSKETAAACAA
jgi:hypothetical protein